MKRLLTRASVAGLSAALVAGVALVAAPAASAATIGTLNFGALANQDQTFSVTTSAACPAGGTNFTISIAGPGLTGSPNINGNTAGSTVGGTTTGPFTAPANFTLAGFAAGQGIVAGYLPAGTFTTTLTCRTSTNPASLGEYVGTFTVTGAGASSVVAPFVPPVNSTTSNPIATGSLVYGGAVTLSSTVSASNPVNTGTVEFREGATVVATSGTVAAGAASATVSNLSVGSHSITAYYLAGSGFNASNSAATVVTIGKGTSPNGTLAVSPAVITGTTPVLGTLSGLATGFTGLCSFSLDGSATVSGTGSASNGVATYSFGSLGAGAHTISAVCAADGNFNATTAVSSSSFTVVSRTIKDLVTQEITVVAPAGTLTITIAGIVDNYAENSDIALPRSSASQVTLPNLTLDSANPTFLSTSGSIKDFFVTDRRSGDLGYVVTAKISDLGGVTDNTKSIKGNDVGIATTLVAFNRPSGLAHLTAAGVLPADGSGANVVNTTGLDDETDIVTAPVGWSLGTVQASGVLSIHAPTSLPAQTYVGVLTLSVYAS